MYYNQYLNCASKHLNGCKALFQSYQPCSHDSHVWLELYYLCGYIIEGIAVYSAYKLYHWPKNEEINTTRYYNEQFTQITSLDFFYERKDSNGVIVFQNRNKNNSLSVQGHHFQSIVKNLLKPDASFNNIPYIGDGKIDSDIEQLIDRWNPDIRYKYVGTTNPVPALNQDTIKRLIDTCQTIYNNHI